MGRDLAELLLEPSQLDAWDQEALFSVSPDELAEAQLQALRRRYVELRPLINLVDRLAEDIGVNDIAELDDVTALCLPHTTYKSYAISYLENQRFDRLTKWLASLTAHDLSDADFEKCTSLESWTAELEATSPLRLLSSSGTSGKMSFFPRSTVE